MWVELGLLHFAMDTVEPQPQASGLTDQARVQRHSSALGRGPLVSLRAADGCIAQVIREPVRATPMSPARLLLR
jgi:hypothetical protein